MTELLAYVHPVLQVLFLVIAFAALRLGLALKQHRLGQRALVQWQGVYKRHTQLGLCFILCLTGGYVLGLLSMSLLRQQAPFRSAHFFFGTMAFLVFLGVGATGWALKRGSKRAADLRDIHGFLVYLGLFVVLAVAVMGLTLLP